MRTIEQQIYKFDELSGEAQRKAVNKWLEYEPYYGWWDHIYEWMKEDLQSSGILLLHVHGFDIDYGRCNIELEIPIKFDDEDAQETYEKEVYERAKNHLLSSLRREYDYITSYEYAKDNIIANEYEFFEDGKQYYKASITQHKGE